MATPSQDPQFFHLPPPPGRSRESTIVLDAQGRFWHEGELVAHPRLAEAMHGWIDRHPDNGRFILNNGYDWSYFTVEGTPFFVTTVRDDGEGNLLLVLSDGTEEPLQGPLVLGEDGALHVQVKAGDARGPYEARLARHAQTLLGPFLVERGGSLALRTRAGEIPVPA